MKIMYSKFINEIIVYLLDRHELTFRQYPLWIFFESVHQFQILSMLAQLSSKALQ